MFKIWCARCGQVYELPEGLAETGIKCTVCGHIQRIPRERAYELAREVAAGRSPSVTPAAGSGDPPRSDAAPSPAASRQATQTRPIRLSSLLRDASHIQGFSVALLSLSIADLLMTYVLFRASRMFYESNPVAQWFFERWNMVGLVLFKFSVIGGVIVLAEIVERHRPKWGKGVLAVGCVAAGYAFAHGLRLYLGFGDGAPMGAE
jgi:hypothetical protein